MSKAALASLVSVILLILVLIYDSYLFMTGGTHATISWFIYQASYEKPFMVFMIGNVLGILCGHLFWQMTKPKVEEKVETKDEPKAKS